MSMMIYESIALQIADARYEHEVNEAETMLNQAAGQMAFPVHLVPKQVTALRGLLKEKRAMIKAEEQRQSEKLVVRKQEPVKKQQTQRSLFD
jgi:hypothetical protein